MTRTETVPPSAKRVPLRMTPAAAAMRMAVIAFAASASPAALAVPLQNALPTGFSVVSGSVDAPTTQAHVMTILQNSGFALIDWTTFDIGSNAGVVFEQPTAAAVVLNRVNGVGRSEIFGSLSGNGTVGVFNSAGVLFGPTSSVNVAGLIASSLNLASASNDGIAVTFDLDFTGASADGAVINRGEITTGAGGVTFMGRLVQNEGGITVGGGGTAALVGGEGATFTLPKDGANPRQVAFTDPVAISGLTGGGAAGVRNPGTITARSGSILLHAAIAPGLLPSVVNNSGLLVASGVDAVGSRDAGVVTLTASGAGVVAEGNIAATGAATGDDGTITVDSDRGVRLGALDAGDEGTVQITAGGDITDGNADAVNVTASRLDATTTDDIVGIETSVSSLFLVSSGANGDIEVQETDDVTVNAQGRSEIEVSSGGSIVVDQIQATGPGSAVVLAADGTVIGTALQNHVRANTLDVTAGGTISLNTRVDTVDAAVSGTGGIAIVEADAITANDLSTQNGGITVRARDDIDVGTISTAGGGNAANIVVLSDQGDIVLGGLVETTGTGDVALLSDRGAIIDGVEDTAVDVIGDNVTMTARLGIGTPGAGFEGAIETSANSLSLTSAGPGPVVVSETDAVDVTLAQASRGPVRIAAGGDLDAVNVSAGGTGGEVTLIAGNGGGIKVGTIATDGATGTVVLSADAGITTRNNHPVSPLLTASVLDATAGNGDIRLQTNVDTASARITGAGDIAISQTGDITLVDVAAADGSVTISAGDIDARQVTADSVTRENDIRLSGGRITLGEIASSGDGDVSITGGIIVDDVNDDAVDVTGDVVTLTASQQGIGAVAGAGSIDTQANRLNLAAGAGSIEVAEADAVTLASATTGNGHINVSAGGTMRALEVASGIDAEGNDITLTAAGDLIVGTITSVTAFTPEGDVTLSATGGRILDNAADTAVDITGDVVTLNARDGVGEAGGTGLIDTSANVLRGTLANAGTFAVQDRTGVRLRAIDVAGGDVEIIAGGTIDAAGIENANTLSLTATAGDIDAGALVAQSVSLEATAGAIRDANGSALNVTANDLTARALTGLSLDTDVTDLDARVQGTGNLVVDEVDDIRLADVRTANGSLGVSAGGDIVAGTIRGNAVELVAGGAILDDNGTATNVSGGSLAARAATGIDLDTAVNTIRARVTGAGAIALDERDGVTLTDVATADGAIRIDAQGTLVLGSVEASNGTGDVHLGSSGGAIVDDVNDDVVDVAGGAVDLAALTGIGNAATGSVDTNVTTLALATSAPGGGNISIDQSGALVLTSVTSTAGDIEIAATGRLEADNVVTLGDVALTAGSDHDLLVGTLGGADVRLAAGNAIVDANGAATNVSGTSLVATAGRAIDLDTAVDSIRATSADRGAITLDELDAVTLRDVSARRGPVSVTAGGTLVADRVASGGGNDITLTATAGNLEAGDIDAGNGNVTLAANTVAGQQVLDDGRLGTRVRANTLEVTASAGIGSAGDLGTDVRTLRADAGTGPLAIRELDGITLESAATEGGDLSVRSGGDLVAGDVDAGTGDVTLASTGGAIRDDGVALTRVAGGTLTARGATGVGLDTRVQRVSATATTGDVRIDDLGGNLEVASVRGERVTLSSSGALLGAGDAPNVRATSLTATAAGRIALSTAVDTVTAQVTDAGSITLSEAGAIELVDVSTAAGDVDVTATGNIATGTVRGDTTRLTSGGAITDANGAGTVNVTGSVLVADAQNGIDLDTEVDTIRRATTVNGSVNIREATSAAVGTIRGRTVNLGAGGALTDENGDATNVTADTLVARAADGIDLDTAIDLLDAEVTGDGALDIADADALTIRNARTNGGDLRLATAGDGNLLILDAGQIDADDGDVTLDIAGAVRQESRRSSAAIEGGSLTINAGGNVGQLLAPLFVNIGGPVTVTFDSDRPVALITGVFGSLNEGGQVFGLGQNTELSNSVGAIQSSFQKTVTFNLDSSQFATQTRIYTTEGTGILLPEEVRE